MCPWGLDSFRCVFTMSLMTGGALERPVPVQQPLLALELVVVRDLHFPYT